MLLDEKNVGFLFSDLLIRHKDINYVFFQGRVPGEAMYLGLWLWENSFRSRATLTKILNKSSYLKMLLLWADVPFVHLLVK